MVVGFAHGLPLRLVDGLVLGRNEVCVLHLLLGLHDTLVDLQPRLPVVRHEGRGSVVRGLEVLHGLRGHDGGGLGDEGLRTDLEVVRVVQRLVLVRHRVDILRS